MKKLSLIILTPFLTSLLAAQDTLTLFECYDAAIANYPVAKQKGILEQTYDYTLSNLEKEYLPSAALNGQVSYQSDVTKMPFEAPMGFTIEELSKDWYKATLDVNQLIYGGGYIKGQKAVEALQYQSGLNEVEVNLYALRERVNKIYFTILMLRKKQEIIGLQTGILEADLKEISSMVKNGVTLESNKNRIKAELLNLMQASSDLKTDLEAMFGSLSELTGLDCNPATRLEQPFIYFKETEVVLNRPEYDLFNTQQQALDANSKLLGSRLMPRVYGFGQAGYGRPGLDMLKNQFDDFYVVGARLSWKFWDWEKIKNDRNILQLKKDIIRTNREAFDKNLRISIIQKKAEIGKIENAMRNDEEIIVLRESITKSASAQLKNGTVTSSDYISELNSEMVARMNLDIHRIQLVAAKADYLILTGNIDEF